MRADKAAPYSLRLGLVGLFRWFRDEQRAIFVHIGAAHGHHERERSNIHHHHF